MAERRVVPHPARRFALVQVLQLPAVALVVVGVGSAALWLAALYASAVCCLGTDSQGPWWNRALLLQAVAWLLLAVSCETASRALGLWP